MSAVEDQIRQAGSRNAELLAVLTQTDYAPSALQQQNSYIKEVEQTVAQNTATLKKLAAQREKEGEDHKKVRPSSNVFPYTRFDHQRRGAPAATDSLSLDLFRFKLTHE